MTERERAINRDLHVLDEAHRLGRITRAEYRARRRRVLESLRDSGGGVTARKTLLPQDATTSPRMRHAHATAAGGDSSAADAMTSLLMRPPLAWKPLLGIVGGVLVLILLGCWLVFRS